jgi:protein-disulfide isomerase
MPASQPRSSKADRRQAARAEAARLQQEQARKAKRTRRLAVGGLAAAVLVLVVIIALVLRQSAATRQAFDDVVFGGGEQDVQAPALADVTAPAGTDDSGGVTVRGDGTAGAAAAPVEVTVYLDFMCPFCGQFESANGPVLAERLAAGQIDLTYRVVSILDAQSSGTFYSTRAANAAAVVADRDPDHYADFVTALFADQPEEGSAGLTDAQIADVATGAGVPADVTTLFTATTSGTYTAGGDQHEGTWRTYAPWVAAVTQQATTDLGELRTPTILIDGEPFTGDFTTAGAFEQALDAAAQ